MKIILSASAFISLAIRRLLSQPGLALLTLLGLVVSVTLIMSVPLYADTVYQRTLLENIQGSGSTSTSPPYTFVFTYSGGLSGPKQWEDLDLFNAFFYNKGTNTLSGSLGLPVILQEQYIATDTGRLFSPDSESVLKNMNLGWMSNLEQHIEILEGSFPQLNEEPGSAVQVLASLPLANQMGLQVGQTYTLVISSRSESGVLVRNEIPLVITGIWQPLDINETYWMFSPSYLLDVLMISQGSFAKQVSPVLTDEVYSAFWYAIFNGAEIRTNQVDLLINQITRMQNKAAALLPDIDFSRSPIKKLISYQSSARTLTILLYAFSIPVIGLILSFVSLVANLSIERKQNEIAITRSRGAATSQIIASITLESLVLGGIAFAISVPISVLLTEWLGVGQVSFSITTIGNAVRGTPLFSGIAAVLVTLVATLSPVMRASRHTVVTYKLERARNLKPAWWQRAWVDLLLLIPTVYGANMLKNQGSLVTGNSDPFSNPLLFLLPSLAVFTLTLLCLRLIPTTMTIIAWLAQQTRSVGILLAARHLARAPSTYHTPFIILVLTLSLSTYTASLAQTLDVHLYDQSYYRIGADLKFTEMGEMRPNSPFGTVQVSETEVSQSFVFLPVSEYQKIKGVEAVTRVGNYSAEVTTSDGSNLEAIFMGIDRLNFPQVAFWRNDFSSQSLGGLMNALASVPEGVLLPRSVMQSLQLQVGDPVQIQVQTDNQANELLFQIVGDLELFPTWYPLETSGIPGRILVVGNLDYLFDQVGGEYPYQVWLKFLPGVGDANNPEDVASQELQRLGLRVVSSESAQPIINATRERPERQGVFGLLFIGFSAAAVLAVLGFLLYAIFSYQRRFIELGVLRAGGLSRQQMGVYLAFEMLFLIGLGGLLGTGLGIWASGYFIPFLQIGAGAADLFPPFQVLINYPMLYQMYALFGILFLVTFVVLVFLLQRMRIFHAIKMGETV